MDDIDENAFPPKRRATDLYRSIQAPQRGITEIINQKIDIQFLGVMIGVCMSEVILVVLALAALRSIGVWDSLDPHLYAVITVSVAIIGFIATISYIRLFTQSGKPHGED